MVGSIQVPFRTRVLQAWTAHAAGLALTGQSCRQERFPWCALIGMAPS